MSRKEPVDVTSVSGTGTSTSGTTATSGTTWTFSGPFYVTQQTLDVDYLRIPGQTNLSSHSITLSSCTATYSPPPNTQVIAIVNATVQASLDFAGYSTSAFQQPQKFQVNSVDVDPNGVSYGLSSHFTASTMGPMGSINTIQPFYSRVPYDNAANQPVFTKTVQTATFTMFDVPSGTFAHQPVDITDYWTDYDLWKDKGINPNSPEGLIPGTFRTSQNPATKVQPGLYNIWGTYDPAKEFIQGQTSMLDTIGTYLRSEDMFASPVANTALTTFAGTQVQRVTRDTGIPEYDKARHEY